MAVAKEKETAKTTAKPAETKTVAEEVKETIKEVPAKAAAAAKTVAKKASAKKTAAEKKEAATKTTAKKAPAKKEVLQAMVTVQFGEKSYTYDELVQIAKDVWKYDLGNKVADLKNIELYVKPQESCVYYVINGEVTGSFGI